MKIFFVFDVVGFVYHHVMPVIQSFFFLSSFSCIFFFSHTYNIHIVSLSRVFLSHFQTRENKRMLLNIFQRSIDCSEE